MLDYSHILSKFPWIVEPQNIILSPDSDGMLCGLLLTNFTGCKVVGYYDGKIMLCKEGINYEDCLFVDMDVNRSNIKSIGHHCVIYNKRIIPETFEYGNNCIQPNVLRNFDGKSDFQKKYPFGTIHLLVCILHHAGIIQNIPEEGIWPLLFTDGVWNNLFGYTENCLEWIEYLGIHNSTNPLYYHFCGDSHSFYNIMKGLDDFLRMRDTFNASGYYNGQEYITGGRNKRTGDKLKISKPDGTRNNIVQNMNLFDIHTSETMRIKSFIQSISQYLDWPYHEEKWEWEGFEIKEFTKGDFSSNTSALNNNSYNELMKLRPFSMAMTSGNNIEYTLE